MFRAGGLPQLEVSQREAERAYRRAPFLGSGRTLATVLALRGLTSLQRSNSGLATELIGKRRASLAPLELVASLLDPRENAALRNTVAEERNIRRA